MEPTELTTIQKLQEQTDRIAEDMAKETKDPILRDLNSIQRPEIQVEGFTIRPAFFQDTAYACALGGNPHSGVWGHGDTVEESIESFKTRFKEQRRGTQIIEAGRA
jgi:hypothetical protein